MASLSGFYVGNIVRHRPKNTTALFIGNRQEANCIAPMGCVMVVGGVCLLWVAIIKTSLLPFLRSVGLKPYATEKSESLSIVFVLCGVNCLQLIAIIVIRVCIIVWVAGKSNAVIYIRVLRAIDMCSLLSVA